MRIHNPGPKGPSERAGREGIWQIEREGLSGLKGFRTERAGQGLKEG